MEPSTSSSGDVETELVVFLSHSGHQKVFVELLNDRLQWAHHTTFFDKETLEKASHFPSDIKRAVRDCKLGVLVLSHDYLLSKWPMLELGWLVSQSKSILPLFYLITIEELKHPDNLSTWKTQWIEMVGLEQAEQWEKAVKKLPAINGVVYQQQGRELAYIEEVATAICNLIPSNVEYDLSYVQGHQHLAKEIEGYFDAPVADERHCGKARIVGLHGVAGLGKTTLCKRMVNHFTSRYLGRSCLIEFPTKYDEHKVVKACKEALEKLAHRQRNVSEVRSFDKVIQIMKKHVSELNVFLAIDNVWESSVEAVGRLLGIGFTADSKVLLTSRSDGVLKELLSHNASKSYNWYIHSLPTPTLTDAFQIFQESLNRSDLTSSMFRDEIEKLLNRCRHKGKYHPLALKALGTHVKKLCGAGDPKMMDANGWSRVLGESKDIDLHDVIELNYRDLKQHLKHMFLDIALWIPVRSSFQNRYSLERTHANTRRWLGFFYKETLINAAIYDLAMAGVIQIETTKDGQEMIQVHDFYLDLAGEEAAKSSRFLITSKNLVEGIDWGNLERVFLEPYTKIPQLHRCQQVQFVFADGIEAEHGIPVMPMVSLHVLILRWAQNEEHPCTSSQIKSNRFRQLPSSARKEEDPCTSSQINVNGFTQLQFLWLEHCHVESFEGLNSLQNLRMLTICACFRLKDIESLRRLTQLQILTVQFCHALKGILDLGEATGLERLVLEGNESLEKVEGRLGPSLEEVLVWGCSALKGILDLGEATGLERLMLYKNGSLEKVKGRLGPALKEVGVGNCSALKGIADLGEATGLERLTLRDNGSLEKVEGHLGRALKEVVVWCCSALKGIPDLGQATGLERLELVTNESLQKVEGRLGPALKKVHVRGCTALKGIPDLGEATDLQGLRLHNNGSLEKVEGRLGPALKEVSVWGCSALKGIPDLGGATGLETLELVDNGSLEKVEGRLGPALKEVRVRGCSALKGILDLGEATRLQGLRLHNNGSLKKVEGCLGPALKEVHVLRCTALKGIRNLGKAARLERLELVGNTSLEKVEGRLGPAMKEVIVKGCMVLKGIPNLGQATSLERLELISNISLEKVEMPLGPAPKEVIVQGCPALWGMDSDEAEAERRFLSRQRIIDITSFPSSVGLVAHGATPPGLELIGNTSLEKVERPLGPAPKEVIVKGCPALKVMDSDEAEAERRLLSRQRIIDITSFHSSVGLVTYGATPPLPPRPPQELLFTSRRRYTRRKGLGLDF